MKYLPANQANDHQSVSYEKTTSAVKRYTGDYGRN